MELRINWEYLFIYLKIIQMKLLSENKLIIYAFENLH